MRLAKRFAATLALACGVLGGAQAAATIVIINRNEAGRRLQRSGRGGAGRRQRRHHARPAAPDRVPARGRHLGRDADQQRHDPHRRLVRAAVVHRRQRGARLGRRGRHLLRLPRRAQEGDLVSERTGEQAGRRRPGRAFRSAHRRALQFAPRPVPRLHAGRRLLPRPGRPGRRAHRSDHRPAARNGARPRLPDLHRRPDRRADQRHAVGLGPLPARQRPQQGVGGDEQCGAGGVGHRRQCPVVERPGRDRGGAGSAGAGVGAGDQRQGSGRACRQFTMSATPRSARRWASRRWSAS